MMNSDKLNNLFAHAQLRNSVNKALNTKKELTQTSTRQIGGASTNRLLDVLKTLLSFSKYFSSNVFLQNNIARSEQSSHTPGGSHQRL